MFTRSSTVGYLVSMFFAFLFLASIVLFFPFLLRTAVLTKVGGHCGGGVCGAVAAVLGVYLKLLLILVGAAIVLYVTVKRVRGTLSCWWGGFAVATVWGAAAFLFAAGNFWGANFSVGLLFATLPWSLLALVVLTVVLSFDIETTPGFTGRITGLTGPFGLPSGKIYVATAVWLSILACLGLAMLPFFRVALVPLLTLSIALHRIGLAWLLSMPVAAIANAVAGVVLVLGLLARRGGGSPEPESVDVARVMRSRRE